MNLSLSVLLLISASSLIACSEKSSGRSYSHTVQETITVNGEEPAAFYRSLLFTSRGRCGYDNIWYRMLYVSGIPVGRNELQQPIRAKLSLMLLANGTFIAKYSEDVVLKETRYGQSIQSQNEKVVEGRYRVEREKLILENLGVGLGVIDNGYRGLILNLNDGFHGLSRRSVVLTMHHSTSPGSKKLNPCK